MKSTRILLLSIVNVLALSCLFAVQTPSTKFVMNVDYARFKYDETALYLEIYYGFYPKLVTLQKIDDKYVGAVSLKTSLRNIVTGAIVRNEHALLPVTLTDTSASSLGNFLTQAGYALPFGEYRLTVTATDSLDPTRGDSIELPISINRYAETATTSDIELCSEIKSSQEKTNAFYKNSLEVVPNASLLYGITGSPVVFHYVELYHMDPAKKYSVRTRLVDPLNKTVRDVSRPRTFRSSEAVDVGTINITSLSSGKYQFLFSVTEDGGGEIAQTNKTFYIYNPHIQVAAATPVEIKASELSGLTAEELAEEFRQAQYVATSEDKSMFSKLSNADGMREFLAKFWVEAEQGKPGKVAVSRAEYLRRVSVANQRYKNQGREGWFTDRGRVYVTYGEPDELERVPSQNNAKPHEQWHYFRIENGVQFVFVDRSGFGDYILVHSTKRGELQDESWQRYLQ